MALYSWFVEANIKLKNKSKFIGKESKQLTIKHKYLESYTMWPIATVIQGEQVTPPLKNTPVVNTDDSMLLAATEKTPLCSVLTVKNTKKTV